MNYITIWKQNCFQMPFAHEKLTIISNFCQIFDNVSHVNRGFQHEEQRPPPYAPSGIYPALPQYPVPQNPQFLDPNPSPPYPSERYSPAQSLHQYAPQTAPVNTFNTTTPGLQRDARLVRKGM